MGRSGTYTGGAGAEGRRARRPRLGPAPRLGALLNRTWLPLAVRLSSRPEQSAVDGPAAERIASELLRTLVAGSGSWKLNHEFRVGVGDLTGHTVLLRRPVRQIRRFLSPTFFWVVATPTDDFDSQPRAEVLIDADTGQVLGLGFSD